MNELQTKQLLFLEGVVNTYTSKNRCVTIDGIGITKCKYAPTNPNTPGCAIGKELTLELAKYLDDTFTGGSNLDKGSAVNNPLLFELLPKELQILERTFLVKVQQLHDDEYFWDVKGLSELGKSQLKSIKNQFYLS